jgi:hypothetical protein
MQTRRKLLTPFLTGAHAPEVATAAPRVAANTACVQVASNPANASPSLRPVSAEPLPPQHLRAIAGGPVPGPTC